MELSSLINNSNRDAYRRSLQSSLHDVLGDVSIDAAQMRGGGVASLLSRAPSPAAASSLLARSLGQQPRFNGMMNASPEELFLAKQAAESHLAKAAFLQQSLAAHQNNKAIQDAYINLLQEKMGAAPPALPPHSFLTSLPLPPQPPAQSLAEKKQQIASTLKALGTNLRSRYDPFIDCLHIEDPDSESVRRSRGGVSEHFPERLHKLLLEVEKDGLSEVIGFYSHGRAFGVHDMDRFINEVMPKYFKQSKWNSFARQLNLYGFMRLASGPDAGGYYHELFLKSRPSLCRYMRRVGVPQGQQDRRKCRPKNVVDIQEPDFYAMQPSR